MARTNFLKHIRKPGAFTAGELVAGEIGVNTVASQLEFSPDGSSIKTLPLLTGSTAPEGSVTAPPGTLYSRSNGEIYRKASGTGNTGWRQLSVRQEMFSFYAANTLYWRFALETVVDLYGVVAANGGTPTMAYSKRDSFAAAATTFTTWTQTFTPGQILTVTCSDMAGSSTVIGTLLFSS